MTTIREASSPPPVALQSRRVVFTDGVRPAIVVIEGGRISAVLEIGSADAHDLTIEDFGDLVIAPGVVDAHVHVNEPGRTDWEGFETATSAAAAGGVTTFADMPLNSSPVTTTAAALEAKRQAARGKCRVDVGFYGGLIPGNIDQIEPLLKAGVLGIKAFLCDSGLDEFPPATLADLQAAAPILRQYNRSLLVHAELMSAPAPKPNSARRYADYLATRPPQWEWDAVSMLLEFCAATHCPVHIVHLANSELLAILDNAKGAGLPITVETCPHYLHFAAEVIPAADARYKCAPPIREQRHREQLWEGLKRGIIDTIGSDHSPCLPEMKQLESGNLMAAWGGIASLQLTLPIIWTSAVERGIALERVFDWLSANPAKLIGLADRKGRIAAGLDADLIVFDPNTSWIVNAAALHHRHQLTPYDGVQLQGQVRRTYLRGKLVFDHDAFTGAPSGQLLSPNQNPKVVDVSIGNFLNTLDDASLRAALMKCCACERWVERMMVERPYTPSDKLLLRHAAEFWWNLGKHDWLQAFSAHPKIGDIDSLRAKFSETRAWAGGEQSGVAAASQAILEKLAVRNRDYEIRFGYIFIVCATGQSADQMLAILESRLANDAETELRIAAAEQLKITELRLKKLVESAASNHEG